MPAKKKTTTRARVKGITSRNELTLLPLRDVIIYPHMIFPVLIGRPSSLKAIGEAMERDKYIFVSAQKDSSVEEPTLKDVYEFGTVARIVQVLRLPNSMLKVLIEGVSQAKVVREIKDTPYAEVEVQWLNPDSADESDTELQGLMKRAGDLFTQYVRNSRALPPEILSAFGNIDDPSHKLYYAAANIQAAVERKQGILEKTTLKDQFFELDSLLTSELEMMKIEEEIDVKVHDSIQKNQRRYFIQEQIRALQKELGDEIEEYAPELSSLKEAIDKAQMPEHALAKAMEEFDRLKKTPSMSPEFAVSRTYIEWLTQIPWKERTEDNLNIDNVFATLEADHYDLEKPKERILEFISVLNLTNSSKGQILCLVGPPGVGKTSLAGSIARALGRKFIRISLGGVRDEAEIRGHRRTYIGSMPGKIVQSMKKAGTVNPVILLDEVDKMSSDFRGDPSAALLEVLDPEQNSTFNDHFIEVDYDLSQVLFIATANVKYDIPAPLLDRMEVIELSSYLDIDKLEIAKRHIVPKRINELGMSDLKINFKEDALLKIIREYTREAGVRQMEREISNVLRKMAKDVVSEVGKTTKVTESGSIRNSAGFKKIAQKRTFTVDEKLIEKYLRAPKFKSKAGQLDDKVGLVTGLAWTSVGGDTLPIEITIMPGTEKLTLTGKLGDVMKESAQAALSFVRSNAERFGVDPEFAKGKEIHIHVPEGAIPKDGPSAGITMTTALISAATGKAVRGDVAMTGEVTLRGNVLAIGGLNEKLLAAKRYGATTVIVPKENERDVKELAPQVTNGLTIHFVSHINEVVQHAFRDSKSKSVKIKRHAE